MTNDDTEEHRARQREYELVERAVNGDRAAATRLLEETNPMVQSIARRLARDADQFEDLVHEGVLGVLHALGRFDPSKETRFTTYARYWVRYYIQRAARRSRRIPTLPRTRKMVKARHGVRRVRRALEQERGGPVGTAEIAEVLGVSVDDVAHVEMEHGGADVSIDGLPRVGGWVFEPKSSRPNPEEQAIEASTERERREAASRCMKVLTQRERFIVEEHILSQGRRTLREIGDDLGISRERVRQLEHRALARMRGEIGGARARVLLAS